MANKSGSKSAIKSFPKTFWTVIVMEFLERGSYYGVMSVLGVFLILSGAEGGLGFSKEQAGAILGTIPPLLYFLPIMAGAIADRYGYRKVLFFAFTCMILGYGFTGLSNSYAMIFLSLILMAVGAGFFKPVISGTIAKNTNQENLGTRIWNFLLVNQPWRIPFSPDSCTHFKGRIIQLYLLHGIIDCICAPAYKPVHLQRAG